MHRCRAFPFALARLFLLIIVNAITNFELRKKPPNIVIGTIKIGRIDVASDTSFVTHETTYPEQQSLSR